MGLTAVKLLGRKFQFLIGTLKTNSPDQPFRWSYSVSIPHRYAKNDGQPPVEATVEARFNSS